MRFPVKPVRNVTTFPGVGRGPSTPIAFCSFPAPRLLSASSRSRKSAYPLGCRECLLVGWRVCWSRRQARTTVYPCETCQDPMHLLPCTPKASGTPKREPTHRTNGALCRSPGGRTAALTDSASAALGGSGLRTCLLSWFLVFSLV